jgi:hypothetical protein
MKRIFLSPWPYKSTPIPGNNSICPGVNNIYWSYFMNKSGFSKKNLLQPFFAVFLGLILAVSVLFFSGCESKSHITKDALLENFVNPPNSARPGVYWYFMDGNLSKEGMTGDLESMKEAGIGHLVFLEVDVGVPKGPVKFLSEEWQDLFVHAVREAERLGIEITLGVGPGWSGSGGPWVKPEQSMLHLVASSINVKGPKKINENLPVPGPRRPYFGEGALTPGLKKIWQAYYKDEYVLAFPTPEGQEKIKDIDEKALYYRAPYTSRPGVKPFLPALANYEQISDRSIIPQNKIIDLSERLKSDGSIEWDVPAGDWTILRLGKRNNGAVTRPAPQPGLGFEINKFSADDFDDHFDLFVGKLLKKVGPRNKSNGGGWTMLHMDSWEMGAQNWTDGFRKEFQTRRGYDPLPYLPTYKGFIVDNIEKSERFLWDVRLTAQELVLENHAGRIKQLGREHGFGLSIEPYDMNPCADLDLGALADVPMCEFWSKGFGFNSAFSCFEATSIAHINGSPVCAAEAFTAGGHEAWKLYPGAMKNQGDWAFATGINRIVYHTFAHKPLDENLRPGMTMGPYGVHWDRGQTWWPMVSEYHKYISRCSYMLQQGNTVADVLYLTAEGAPHVFLPPKSMVAGNDTIPDRRGYNFDGCSPLMLMEKATVQDNKIVFPGGASYHLLVLPNFHTMTPELLEKIESLVEQGARVLGNPPKKSPSLVNYPRCDEIVTTKAKHMWKSLDVPDSKTNLKYGKGTIYWGGEYSMPDSSFLFPHYYTTDELLNGLFVDIDFESTGPIRYTHRKTKNLDIYFVSNKTEMMVDATCFFRVKKGTPELWDPITGNIRKLKNYDWQEYRTTIPLKFSPYQSYFIIFDRTEKRKEGKKGPHSNFPIKTEIAELKGPWAVSFNPKWGGPEKATFVSLQDWTKRPEDGIKYYSGIAVYKKNFDLPEGHSPQLDNKLLLDLGDVNHLARVKLNGNDLGVLWTAPWSVDMTESVREKNNALEIEVVNLWPNRLIGDERFPDDGIKNGEWPDWLLEGKERTSGRFTFTTKKYFKKDSPLLKSGLLGPVKILKSAN